MSPRVHLSGTQEFSGKTFSKLPMALLLRVRHAARRSTEVMKAYLQHDDSGLFYNEGGQWVETPGRALAFTTPAEAEAFQNDRHVNSSHVVSRIDPSVISRLSARAPGRYQVGE